MGVWLLKACIDFIKWYHYTAQPIPYRMLFVQYVNWNFNLSKASFVRMCFGFACVRARPMYKCLHAYCGYYGTYSFLCFYYCFSFLRFFFLFIVLHLLSKADNEILLEIVFQVGILNFHQICQYCCCCCWCRSWCCCRFYLGE